MRRMPHLRGLSGARSRTFAMWAWIPRANASGSPSWWRPCRWGSTSASGSRWSTCCASAGSRCGSPSWSGSTSSPVVDLLLRAPGERRLPHRRPRAGLLVRRRHRPQGDQVRRRALLRRRRARHAPDARLRQHAAAPAPRRPRLRAVGPQGARRHDRPARRAGAVAGRGARPRRGRARRPLGVLRAVGRQGRPRWSRRRPAYPWPSRVAHLAEFLEVAHRTDGIDGAVAWPGVGPAPSSTRPSSRSSIADAEKVFHGLDETDSWDAVIDGEPALRARCSAGRVRRGAGRHRTVRRPEVAVTPLGHSAAVARLAAAAAAGLGLPAADQQLVRRAGLVSGFGRLGVSNAIWDKPGSLTASDWERVRLYPAYTERMLRRPGAGHRWPGRRPGGRAPRRVRLSGRARGRRPHPAQPDPRHRGDVPDQARGPTAPAGARRRPRRRRSCGTRCAPAGWTARWSTRCCAPPASGCQRRQAGPAGLTAREMEVLHCLVRGLSNREIAKRW